MANKHRRHSSLDTLGWMYTNRARDEPPPPLDRSISSRISSFRREVFPTEGLKRQSSLRFNPGEYLAGCFGPRNQLTRGHGHDSQHPILADPGGNRVTTGRPPRSRSISLGNFEFDFGSMRFKEKGHHNGDLRLALRAAELNHQAATHKQRVVQPGVRWVMEDDAEYYLKPPAWKQAWRKLRAEAKRHVHPFPPRELSPVNYDEENYEKNFDSGGRAALYLAADEELVDDFGERARLRHSQLLTKLYSQRFEGDAIGQELFPPGNLVKTLSAPVVLPVRPHHRRDYGVPIWERRVGSRPITNLELTRSL